MSFNASIVLFRTPQHEVETAVQTLRQCSQTEHIWLIDNGETEQTCYQKLDAEYIFNGHNLGYGAAHNIALHKSIDAGTPFHLVLNADVRFHGLDLEPALAFMDKNPDVGLLSPKVLNPDGSVQHLCKLLPTPFDLFGRRFLPASWMRRRTERFEMHASGYDHIMNVPYLSGCFMLLRTEALRVVGVFDPRFFLYPEDIDLTRRLHHRYRTLFWPELCVEHRHEQGSYHSTRLLWLHLTNMARYFDKWGWLFDGERTAINRQTIDEILLYHQKTIHL